MQEKLTAAASSAAAAVGTNSNNDIQTLQWMGFTYDSSKQALLVMKWECTRSNGIIISTTITFKFSNK